MSVFVVLSGLPGSGKSTEARRIMGEAQKAAGRPGTAAIIARDTIRENVLGLTMGPGDQILDHAGEDVVTAVEDASVEALLAAGVELVIVDATHLTPRSVDRWRQVAARHGAEFEAIRLDVDVDECIRRDAARAAAGGRYVGAEVIRGIAARGAATWQEV